MGPIVNVFVTHYFAAASGNASGQLAQSTKYITNNGGGGHRCA